MRKISSILLASSIIFTIQPVFADDADMMSSINSTNGNPCEMIAKACTAAGFTRDDSTVGKRFWQDCMKPVILGKTVTSVTIDPMVAQTCKTQKVMELKQELQDFGPRDIDSK